MSPCALAWIPFLLCCFAVSASAKEPGAGFARFVPSPAIRVWPADRVGATQLTTHIAVDRPAESTPGPNRLLVLPPLPALFAPPEPIRSGFSLHKIGVRELMNGALPLDRHSAADRYSAAGVEAESVYVVQLGQSSDIIAYGKRYGATGGAGTLHLGKIVEASGTALFSKDGQVSITHNLDLNITKIALNGPGVSVSPFARGGFLLDFYRDGVRRVTIVPGGGLHFTFPTGYLQPLLLAVMASPEVIVEPGNGPVRLGARLMTGAEIFMF